MKNVMKIDGYDAVINYDPEIEMFRGEFINLNGGADFYASDINGLHNIYIDTHDNAKATS